MKKWSVDHKIRNAVGYINVLLDLPRSPRWIEEKFKIFIRMAERDPFAQEFYEDSVIMHFLSQGLK
jgi:hypothetical protein